MISAIGLAGLAGCAAAPTFDSGDALMQASAETTDTVVFGKFRLIRNGEEAQLGQSLFTSAATLRVDSVDGAHGIMGQVGRDGEFAWTLQPGQYRVTSVGFHSRGEKAQADTNFTFFVPEGHDAVYVGTLTLDTVFDSGYYGLNGAVHDFDVSNDCRTDCAERLTQLDLSTDAAIVALMGEASHLASAD